MGREEPNTQDKFTFHHQVLLMTGTSVGGQPILAICGESSQAGVLGCLECEWERASHDESEDVHMELLTEPSASIKPTETFSWRNR